VKIPVFVNAVRADFSARTDHRQTIYPLDSKAYDLGHFKARLWQFLLSFSSINAIQKPMTIPTDQDGARRGLGEGIVCTLRPCINAIGSQNVIVTTLFVNCTWHYIAFVLPF